MTLFLENNNNLLMKRFTYIFILTYTLNASKINNKIVNIKRKTIVYYFYLANWCSILYLAFGDHAYLYLLNCTFVLDASCFISFFYMC